MKIEFSPKYEPLFDLLECWDVIASDDFKELDKEDQEYWTNLSKVDTVLISGGRDSGKSFALSCFNPIASKDYNHRILYTRQTMSSTDNSITQALENRLEMLGYLSDFEQGNKNYQVKEGLGRITITGQKTSSGTQTAKLKSLEDYSIFETDEGEELESFEAWNKIKRSMRAKDVQCLSIIVFNPPTREHWIFEEFYESFYDTLKDPNEINGVRGNVMYIHTDYRDNLENMAEHNVKEYEELKEAFEKYESLPKDEKESAVKLRKKWKQYKFEILGGFKDVAEGVIYDDWEIGEFPEHLPYMYGLDYGSNDPDACVKLAIDFDNNKIHIDEIIYQNNSGTSQLAEMLSERVGHTDLIIADSNARRITRDLYDGVYGENGFIAGLNVKSVSKTRGGKDSFVKASIKKCQGFTLVFTKESKNCLKSVKNYVWHDSRAGVPKHDWSHLPDAWRYAAWEILNDYV